MSDLPAATAAGTIKQVSGRSFEMRPLTLRDFGLLEREALAYYRSNRLEALEQALHLLPPDRQLDAVERTVAENAKLTESDLPQRVFMYDADGSVTTDEEASVRKEKVPYVSWFVSFTGRGRLFTVYLSMRKANPEITLEEIEELFDDESALEDFANTVGDISAPTAGNSRPRRRTTKGKTTASGAS